LLVGFGLILVSAFFDNIRGLVLPIFSGDYGLSHTQASAFFWVAGASAFLGSAASVRLLESWSHGRYLRVCLILQAAAVLCVGSGMGYASLIIGGFFWGAANNGIGFSANLVVLHGSTDAERGRRMSALHLFYGLGAALPAFYVAPLAARAIAPQAMVLPTIALAAILWPCAGLLAAGPHRADEENVPRMHWRQMFRRNSLSLVGVLSIYVLGEVLTSMWLATFLIDAEGFTADHASRFQQTYFLALAASRALGAVFIKPGAEKVLPGPLMLAAALAAAAGASGRPWGFVLASFCFGPVFPLLASRLAGDHPRDYPRLMAFGFALMTVLLALGHAVLGRIADIAGLRAAFSIQPVCLLSAVLLLWTLPSPAQDSRP
jgi:fucose permease